MNVVVDASMAIKWFFRLRDDERDIGAALELLRGVLDDRVKLIQPPHFIAEMGRCSRARCRARPQLR